jgi:hypothetical protein
VETPSFPQDNQKNQNHTKNVKTMIAFLPAKRLSALPSVIRRQRCFMPKTYTAWVFYPEKEEIV